MNFKFLGKDYEKSSSTPPKLQRRPPKNGGEAAIWVYRFFEFWKGGPHKVFSEEFASSSVISTQDNNSNPCIRLVK